MFDFVFLVFSFHNLSKSFFEYPIDPVYLLTKYHSTLKKRAPFRFHHTIIISLSLRHSLLDQQLQMKHPFANHYYQI